MSIIRARSSIYLPHYQTIRVVVFIVVVVFSTVRIVVHTHLVRFQHGIEPKHSANCKELQNDCIMACQGNLGQESLLTRSTFDTYHALSVLGVTNQKLCI